MALYIAVCDDNAADRKQLERLLDRENVIRNNAGVPLYIDSFGSREALMKTPNRYNLFLVDINEGPGITSLDIADEIRSLGTGALIVLTGTDVDPDVPDLYETYILRSKPLTAKDISELVDMALEHVQDKIPLIEIRCHEKTVFVKPDEFICAVEHKNGFGMDVMLEDGRRLESSENIGQFGLGLSSYPGMLRCSNSYINLSFVRSVGPFHVIMSDGTRLPVSALTNRKIKKYQKDLEQ